MKTIILKRIASRYDGTFGVLLLKNDRGYMPFAVTVERPWVNNERGKSCIPICEYCCKRVNSPKFGDTFEVTGVVERSHILFHKGNISDDSRGCIIIGEMFEPLLGKPAVLSSRKGFDEFMAILKNDNEFIFELENCYG